MKIKCKMQDIINYYPKWKDITCFCGDEEISSGLRFASWDLRRRNYEDNSPGTMLFRFIAN